MSFPQTLALSKLTAINLQGELGEQTQNQPKLLMSSTQREAYMEEPVRRLTPCTRLGRGISLCPRTYIEGELGIFLSPSA